MDAITIKTVEQFIAQVRADSAGWPYKWFRGEPAADTPLIPKLYRLRPDGARGMKTRCFNCSE